LLQDAAPEQRKQTALEALSNVIAEVQAGKRADSCDYNLWIYLSLRLLKDQADDPAVRAKLHELRQLDKIDRVFKECRDDPELHPLLETADTTDDGEG
jgi:hypothetical protein